MMESQNHVKKFGDMCIKTERRVVIQSKLDHKGNSFVSWDNRTNTAQIPLNIKA
jgi:hypothetical protein